MDCRLGGLPRAAITTPCSTVGVQSICTELWCNPSLLSCRNLFFPPQHEGAAPQLSPKELGKQRLSMILVADRCKKLTEHTHLLNAAARCVVQLAAATNPYTYRATVLR